jgi:site-specific recombinase XerD
MIKRAAERAGVNQAVSAHWLRHAHASHALGRGATDGEVRDTLGHANVATTSAYLGGHALSRHLSGRRLHSQNFAAPGSGGRCSTVVARIIRSWKWNTFST